MKIYISNFKRLLILIPTICFCLQANSQIDSTLIKRAPIDTSTQKMNMDAIYSRPFLNVGKAPIAIGGYLEANTQYLSTDGVSDGFSFQMRRMTLFLSSTVAKNLKFLSEIEFEDGAKEINIEFAALDIEFHPLLNLRGGIIMNPIGSFNQNHDGPRWDFIDRPISSTTIIPSTLSNVGFGIYGKYFLPNFSLGYEAYLTNGFDDKIISNNNNRTSLASGKANIGKFEESNSGLPMLTAKIGIRNRKIGELGFSIMNGVYNKWRSDGFILDKKRSLTVLALDFNTSLIRNKLNINSELTKVMVDIPETYIQTYGAEQVGFFIDFVGTVAQRKILNWEKAKINMVLRLEYADYNKGNFKETGGNIADDIWALVPGISFRPVGNTVLRFNYRSQWQSDFLGNPSTKTGVIQFGFSSYF